MGSVDFYLPIYNEFKFERKYFILISLNDKFTFSQSLLSCFYFHYHVTAKQSNSDKCVKCSTNTTFSSPIFKFFPTPRTNNCVNVSQPDFSYYFMVITLCRYVINTVFELPLSHQVVYCSSIIGNKKAGSYQSSSE